MSSQLWWYLARASGIVAWALVTASVLWGLFLSTRVLGPKPRPNWLLDLHRFLGGLAVVFSAIHVTGLVLDSYVSFGPVQLLVPFTSSYRPGAVAWGIIGAYLLAAVEITSLLRKHLSRRAWHLTHLLSFPLFAMSTVHGLVAGTDATGLPLRVAMGAASVAVVALTAARIEQARPAISTGQPPTPNLGRRGLHAPHDQHDRRPRSHHDRTQRRPGATAAVPPRRGQHLGLG